MIATIAKATRLSMDLLISGTRWSMLLAPVVFSFVQPARATDTNIVTATVDYLDEDEAPQSLSPAIVSPAIESFGPFRVVSPKVVELVGGVTTDTPARFAALLARFPAVKSLDLVECPGSLDDDANLELARMIRKAGLTTHIPSGGSIRSGGVDLFLAGVSHVADPGAEIGVHSWQDSDGLEAKDFPPDDPVHALYLTYYREIGMSADDAKAFYDFTNNAAPFDGLHVMSRAEMARFGLDSGR
jgi:hypothetical protein